MRYLRSRRHEVYVIHVVDREEADPPIRGDLRLVDSLRESHGEVPAFRGVTASGALLEVLVGPDGKPIENPGESAEWIGIIIEEVNRLNNVVTQFLDYARPFELHIGPIDLNALVADTLA